MTPPDVLLLLGGHYHDFAGFEAFARRLLGPEGYRVRASYDPGDLRELGAVDVVVIYTCHVEPPDDPEQGLQYTAGFSDDETASLVEWVRSGGGLVAAHSATTIRPDNAELVRLIGGRFVSHPPRFPVTVYPLQHDHPVTRGLGPFTVVDELYTQHYTDVDIHAVAIDRGLAFPMVWTRSEGSGRVVHVALGHDASVWEDRTYQRLLRQAVAWSARSPSAPA